LIQTNCHLLSIECQWKRFQRMSILRKHRFGFKVNQAGIFFAT
jgi:hypothetical protein